MTVLFPSLRGYFGLFPPAQDPAGSGHERFHATEEAHRPEDGPQSPRRSGEVKEADTNQRLLLDGASSNS